MGSANNVGTSSGPHFGGWEIYHVSKDQPVDPNRLYARRSPAVGSGNRSSSSNDGGKTWAPVGNKFEYDGIPGTHQMVRRQAASVGV